MGFLILGLLYVLGGVFVLWRYREVGDGIARFHQSIGHLAPWLYRPLLPLLKSRYFWSFMAIAMGLLFVALGAYFVSLSQRG